MSETLFAQGKWTFGYSFGQSYSSFLVTKGKNYSCNDDLLNYIQAQNYIFGTTGDVQAKYKLTSKWNLTTGLRYIKNGSKFLNGFTIHSECSVGPSSVWKTNFYQYNIQIPIGLEYNFYSKNKHSFWASFGVSPLYSFKRIEEQYDINYKIDVSKIVIFGQNDFRSRVFNINAYTGMSYNYQWKKNIVMFTQTLFEMGTMSVFKPGVLDYRTISYSLSLGFLLNQNVFSKK